ncbi:MAG: hypothetical protein AB7V08_13815 [Elusimicrobiales bacterium]
MSGKKTTDLANTIATAVRTALNGGFLYLYSGPVPATADEALDMVNDHTEIGKFSESDDGVTGLTFDAAAAGRIDKAAAEDWRTTTSFDGADDGETDLAPTFWRFCPDGDDGRGSATGARVQGTAGGPASGADLRFGSNTLGNGVEQPISAFGLNYKL